MMRALAFARRARQFSRMILVALCCAFITAPRAAAQSSDHDAVRVVVKGLFDAMRTRDTSAMRAAFDSTAILRSITARGVRGDAVDAWISSVANAPAGLVLDERIGEPRIELDGPLATAWVPYHFYAGDRFSHCGVNSFILAKAGSAWKILAVVDTRQREGCTVTP
jgi:hypothetical protein